MPQDTNSVDVPTSELLQQGSGCLRTCVVIFWLKHEIRLGYWNSQKWQVTP